MKKFIILVFSALLTVSAYSQTTDSEETESQESQSRAWYIMHQMNTAPLLLGLTQQLGRVVESPERNNSIWNGIEEGGTLELNITVEGDISGEIFVGFFEEPEWLSAPVQVRSFPASGVYTIESLPPGQFQIGAMIGSLPAATALGVQQQWPEPVVIEKGKTASANILVSGDIQLQASRAYANIAAKDFFDDWNDLDVQNLLHGRVTGPDGQPVPFALVQIREYNPGAGGIAAPDCGTNEQGYYKYDGIKWPYTLGVIRYKLMPSVFGYWHQFLMYNHVFDECETVDFQFDNFPAGNSSIKGRVLDQNENPLKEFFIDIRTRMDWDVRNNPDDKYYTVTGYHLPFMSGALGG